ncbi:MAG: hypothetical protein HN435_04965 [Nitrospinaceae bacterium]|nr:hypothetical protein [Nitrospinaceae bacterium]
MGEFTCFDTVLVECIRRHPSTIQDFCRKNFQECPYYHIDGPRARFGGKRRFPSSKITRLVV